MPVEIRVPPLGESLVDAVVGQWLKGEGDQVSRGETIVELAAPFAEPVSAAAASVPQTAPAPAPEPATVGDGGRAAPAVRMLASEHSVDLNAVEGTGPGGRVTREDVLAAVARNLTTPPRAPEATPQVAPPAPAPASQPVAPAPAPVPAPMVAVNGREERVRMSRRRQTIAARLVEAQQTAAMLTTFNEIDMTAIMELRAARKDAFKEKHGVGLGFMSFFTKAVVGALKAFPRVNAEIQGDEMVLKHYYDIGIAVGTDEGLVVPVVRDADRKTFAEIEKNIGELAVKARDGKLEISDLTGGTFTITNGGIYGSLLSTPILNAPQSGILGMHAIQQRPVAKNGEVVIRPMMYVALSYDHRIVDGSEAVRFLVRVKELAEDPTNLLLEG